MKTYIIVGLLFAALLSSAFLIGKKVTESGYKENLNKQIIIQKNTDNKVSKYTDTDMCTTVLGGKLSESGECE